MAFEERGGEEWVVLWDQKVDTMGRVDTCDMSAHVGSSEAESDTVLSMLSEKNFHLETYRTDNVNFDKYFFFFTHK